MRDTIGQNPSPPESTATNQNQELAQAILHAITGLRFGSVEITIHDAKVVQIERIEKIRLETVDTRKGR